MKNKPDMPGLYWWRESAMGEWEPVLVTKVIGGGAQPMLTAFFLDTRTGRTSKFGSKYAIGQWVKCEPPEDVE